MSFINKNKHFSDLISEELKKRGFKEGDENEKKLFYCDITYGKRKNPSYFKCEIVNQLSNVKLLGNKKDQYQNHLNYYQTRPDYLPFTISFNLDTQDLVNDLFMQNPRESPKVFIIKPENDSFRKGVGIVRNRMEFQSHLNKYPKYYNWIIQDYIDDPLLINRRKFHLRIYVIYMQTPEYQVAYLSRNGFMYTANKEFEKGVFDEDVVLSGENAPINVFYLPEDFQKEFGKNIWENVVWNQLVKITRETIKSTLDYLQCPSENQKCFKILGYDILIDKNFKCYLAEINARSVTFKYPNEKFKSSFYKNILEMVLAPEPLSNDELKKKGIPYQRILYKSNGIVSEGFNGIIRQSQILMQEGIESNRKFDRWYWNLFFPFLILILIVITFQVRK